MGIGRKDRNGEQPPPVYFHPGTNERTAAMSEDSLFLSKPPSSPFYRRGKPRLRAVTVCVGRESSSCRASFFTAPSAWNGTGGGKVTLRLSWDSEVVALVGLSCPVSKMGWQRPRAPRAAAPQRRFPAPTSPPEKRASSPLEVQARSGPAAASGAQTVSPALQRPQSASPQSLSVPLGNPPSPSPRHRP